MSSPSALVAPPHARYFELRASVVQHDIVLVHDYLHEKDDEEGTLADLGAEPDNPNKTIVYGTCAAIDRGAQRSLLLQMMSSIARAHRATVRRTVLDITTYETALVTVAPERPPLVEPQPDYAPCDEVPRIVAIMAPINSLTAPLTETLRRLGVGSPNTVTIVQGTESEFNTTQSSDQGVVPAAAALATAHGGALIVASSNLTRMPPPNGYIAAMERVAPAVLRDASVPFVMQQVSDRVPPSASFAANLIVRPGVEAPVLGLPPEPSGAALLAAMRAHVATPNHFGTNVTGPFYVLCSYLSDDDLARLLETAAPNSRLYCAQVPPPPAGKDAWVGRRPAVVAEAELAARFAIVAAALCYRTVDPATDQPATVAQTLEAWAATIPEGAPCAIRKEWLPVAAGSARIGHDRFPGMVLDASRQAEVAAGLVATYRAKRTEHTDLFFAAVYDAAVLQMVNDLAACASAAQLAAVVARIDGAAYKTEAASDRLLGNLAGGIDPTAAPPAESVDEGVPPEQ
jgi:hypothetical protein